MHDVNQGVGGAFLTGMRYAIERGADIIVKVDADGQMDPAQVPALIHPIASGQADYVKGDRFFFLTNAASMPPVRRFGNLALSFLAKISSGYWTIMDPTNGFFAIHARVAELLDDERIAKRFFFETDLLFHLGLIRAKVVEFPMRALLRQRGLEPARVAPARAVPRGPSAQHHAPHPLPLFLPRPLAGLAAARRRQRAVCASAWCSASITGGPRRRTSWCRPAPS